MREQRARRRRIFVGRQLPNEVQALAGARRGDVEEPRALGGIALAFRAAHEVGQPRAVRLVRKRSRNHDEVVAAVGRRRASHCRRLGLVGTRLAREAEQHDGVELESFRPVHRHDLDALLARRIGLRLHGLERALQHDRVVEVAAALARGEQREELFRRRALGGVVEARGPAEREPRALDPAAQRARARARRTRPSAPRRRCARAPGRRR